MSQFPVPSPLPADNDLPDETPEALRGIAERVQHALNELFSAKADAELLDEAVTLPLEVQRVLSAARGAVGPILDPVSSSEPTESDRRLYLPRPDGWEARIKTGIREYCYYRHPGEDWFHMILPGELYLELGAEKVCLNCAVRQGILTDDRLFWQQVRRGSKQAAAFEPAQTVYREFDPNQHPTSATHSSNDSTGVNRPSASGETLHSNAASSQAKQNLEGATS